MRQYRDFVTITALTCLAFFACDVGDGIQDDSASQPAPIYSFTLDDLSQLEYGVVEPGRLVHRGDENLGVEVLQGREGAQLYAQKLRDQLSVLEERDDWSAKAELEMYELIEELEVLEDLLTKDNWVTTKNSGLTSSVCGIRYTQKYTFHPWFYSFALEVTTTTTSNGVGPRPPTEISGWIKAKALINPGLPNQIKNVTQTTVPDTWLQSHSAVARSESQLHSSNDLLTWKAASVTMADYPGCTGFSRILVWGRASYMSNPIVDNIYVD